MRIVFLGAYTGMAVIDVLISISIFFCLFFNSDTGVALLEVFLPHGGWWLLRTLDYVTRGKDPRFRGILSKSMP